jgi:MFS family permease
MSSKEETESDLVAMDLEQARDGTVQPAPEEKNVKLTEFTYVTFLFFNEKSSLIRSSIAAILNLIGSVSILFCSTGFTNAYGVFQEYYSQTLLSHKTPSEIAWIGSFDLFIMFAAALPVGYLNDLYGPRVCINRRVRGHS